MGGSATCKLRSSRVAFSSEGQVPSYHTKQLALHGALELLSGDRFCSHITVG